MVYVLPNNKNIIMAAQQCVRLVEGKKVVVLPRPRRCPRASPP